MATFTRSSSRKIPSWVFLLLVAAAVVGWLGAVFGRWPVWVSRPLDAISAFSAVFLSIFIEALPFLLLGTVASGIVEVFFGPDEFSRWMPRNPLLASLAGSLLGMFFPVCECGVVPLSRRMLRKGLPEQAGVAFLLGAPVLNPVVMASTLAAFGWGPVFWGRIGLTLLVAVLAGLILPILPGRKEFLRLDGLEMQAEPILTLDTGTPKPSRGEKWRRVLVIASDDLFDMGRYLTIGALLASAMQSLVPQGSLLAISRGPVLPVIALAALAVILSICSTVDAFIALAFTGIFSTGSILAFLVFGPMVDIKSTLMFLRAFQRRKVVYMILLPLGLVVMSGILWNLFSPW